MRIKGFILLNTIVFSAIAITLVVAFVGWAGASLKSAANLVKREQAFEIAEAGIDYYRWHLAHATNDYQDGTGQPGPYVHAFNDKDGNQIGTFTLTITPPPIGSTLVIIESKGTLISDPNISRTVVTHLAIPSWARFALVTNADTRFIEGAEFFGPVHSNGGIRFDALAHNVVTSGKASYIDTSHPGTTQEFGVHTHVKPPPQNGISGGNYVAAEAPPSVMENRPDVFIAGRQFPVPQVDFVGITSNLAAFKTDAQTSGNYFAASGALGYHIVLKTDDTFDIYRVNSLAPVPRNSCKNISNQNGWGTWSINPSAGGQTLIGNFPNPTNGLIFTEDDVWVDGTVNSARLTIAAAKFPDNPSTRKNIIINHSINYTNFDGQDVVGLIAQNNAIIGLFADEELVINAALIAQNGNLIRYNYPGPGNGNGSAQCSPNDVLTSFNSYGMIGSNLQGVLSYSNDASGFLSRTYTYDANLLYSPPPSFPRTSDKYSTIFWQELQ